MRTRSFNSLLIFGEEARGLGLGEGIRVIDDIEGDKRMRALRTGTPTPNADEMFRRHRTTT